MLTRDEIQRLIPHRDPFLWIDEVVDESANRLVARKMIPADLDIFRGHYPGRPVLPGVLLCEAAMQAGAVLIARQGLPALMSVMQRVAAGGLDPESGQAIIAVLQQKATPEQVEKAYSFVMAQSSVSWNAALSSATFGPVTP